MTSSCRNPHHLIPLARLCKCTCTVHRRGISSPELRRQQCPSHSRRSARAEAHTPPQCRAQCTGRAACPAWTHTAARWLQWHELGCHPTACAERRLAPHPVYMIVIMIVDISSVSRSGVYYPMKLCLQALSTCSCLNLQGLAAAMTHYAPIWPAD